MGDETGDRFRTRREGLFAIDSAGTETRVCDAIWHLGNAVRDDGGGAADVVEFVDRTGAVQRVLIPHRDSVISTTKVLEVLADHNFAVPQGRQNREQLLTALAQGREAPRKTFILAQRMGWHGGSFVIGNDVISIDASKSLILEGPISQYAKKFGRKGTLSHYQSRILRRASHSSRLMAGIALALLAPLARVIGLENGGLNIIGAAGIGKTTILRVVGSFYGGGAVPYIEPWLMTDNAPETLGRAHCDLPLLLDELDALEPDQTKSASRLKTIVHRLCIGQSKAVSHRVVGEDAMRTDFFLIFGSTSEHPLPKFMREGGGQVTAGQAARLVDLPADAGEGLKIFETLPAKFSADEYLQKLNRACQKYYGVAGSAYLRRLVDDLARGGGGVEAFMRRRMKLFQTEVAIDTRVDERIRRRFEALYAAGELGLHYGILPPACNWFMKAIASCYRAAITNQSQPSLSVTEAGERLIEFLDSNRHRLLKVNGNRAITKGAYEKALGLRPDPARHGRRLWLKSTVLQKLVFPPGTVESAVTELVRAGVIIPSTKGLRAQQQRIPGLGTKEYFYVIDSAKLRALSN